MSTAKLERVSARCEQCGKEFLAVMRQTKKLQRYCGAVCQRESREANDLPSEAEIKRRAECIKYLRVNRGVVNIKKDMLDWYKHGVQTALLHSDSLSRVNRYTSAAFCDISV